MKRYEYYTLWGRNDDDTNQSLDELGNDGWEGFAAVPSGDGIVIYLKREKPS